MRDQSTYSVFQSIVRHGALTKRQVQELTGLSWGSVFNSIAKLSDVGVFHTVIKQHAAAGRIPSYYAVSKQNYLCIGIEVAMDRVLGRIQALTGEGIYSCSRILHDNQSDLALEALFQVLEELFQKVANPSTIKAIGIALPGIIDTLKGRAMFVHHFQGFFPENMAEIVQQRFGVDAMIFHDTDCNLISELNARLPEEHIDDMMMFRWSYGIGMSMMLHGVLRNGSNGTAGEIGHMVMNPSGPLCTCGKTGCLEAYASVNAALKSVRRAIGMGLCEPLLVDAKNLSSKDLLDALEAGNTYVESVIDSAIEYVAIALANAVNIIDPLHIIIAGEFSALPEQKYALLKRTIDKYKFGHNEVHILPAVLRDGAAATGAGLMLADKIYYEYIDSKISGISVPANEHVD